MVVLVEKIFSLVWKIFFAVCGNYTLFVKVHIHFSRSALFVGNYCNLGLRFRDFYVILFMGYYSIFMVLDWRLYYGSY